MSERQQPVPSDQPSTVEPVRSAGPGRIRQGTAYAQAVALGALGLIVLLLAVANTNRTTLHWIVGSTRAAVVWIVLVSAGVGWLAGLVTAVLFRRRVRRR